jgi:hypothetical protein
MNGGWPGGLLGLQDDVILLVSQPTPGRIRTRGQLLTE